MNNSEQEIKRLADLAKKLCALDLTNKMNVIMANVLMGCLNAQANLALDNLKNGHFKECLNNCYDTMPDVWCENCSLFKDDYI